MLNSVIRSSRAKGPLRAVDPAHVEAPAATSIMSTAAAILREELQSLAESAASPLSPALGANALFAGQPPRNDAANCNTWLMLCRVSSTCRPVN